MNASFLQLHFLTINLVLKIESELERRDYGGFGLSKENSSYKMGINWIALLSSPKASQDLLGNKSRFREALNTYLTFNITEKLKNTFDMKLDFIKGDKNVFFNE